MLETVALAAAIHQRKPKLPYICMRQALGPPWTERQRNLVKTSKCGCFALGEVCAEGWRGARERWLAAEKAGVNMKELAKDWYGFPMYIPDVNAEKEAKKKAARATTDTRDTSLTTTACDVDVVEEKAMITVITTR